MRRKLRVKIFENLGRWKEGKVEGWVEAKAGLRIAYSNQKSTHTQTLIYTKNTQTFFNFSFFILPCLTFYMKRRNTFLSLPPLSFHCLCMTQLRNTLDSTLSVFGHLLQTIKCGHTHPHFYFPFTLCSLVFRVRRGLDSNPK